MRARDVALGVFAVTVATVFLRLGFWQLERRRERQTENATTAARLTAAPAPLSALPRDPAVAMYRRVLLAGTLDFEHEVVLGNRGREGAPGVDILTPLRMVGSDTAVLVNRGWVYSPDASSIRLDLWREPEALTGIGYVARFSVADPSRGPAASSSGVLFRPDSAVVAARLPYPIAPYYVVLSPPDSEVVWQGTPIRVPPPPLDEGPHLSYALQWFTFATISLVGVATVLWSTRRGGSGVG